MADKPNIATINLASVKIDGGTQSRSALNEAVVADYAEAVDALPPVVVYFDGSVYWLADGFHRFHAHRKAGRQAMKADVRTGTKRDAILHSVGANAAHGLRRTNDDKRRAVMTLLQDAEWSTWSDRDTAKACGVSHNFVGTVRASLSSDDSDKPTERTYTTKHGTQATMKTGAIGKSKPAPVVAPVPAPPVSKVAAPEVDHDDGPDLSELVDELQAENARLVGLIQAAEADDLAAEAVKWKRCYDNAVRQQSEAMDSAARSEKREKWTHRQLMRCGKAVGEDDPTKIAPIVEAMARARAAA